MGWADCGTDSEGRPIGYAFEATCDHPECDAKIDRGLSYACGGMHGEVSVSNGQGGDFVPTCEKYFCEKHLIPVEADFGGHVTTHGVCMACYMDIEHYLGIDDEAQVIGLSVPQSGGRELPEASAVGEGNSPPEGRTLGHHRSGPEQ